VRGQAKGDPQNEGGQSFLLMLLLLLPLLLLVLGAVHDLGNVAAGVTVAQNAADLAAQEAGKLVDVSHFIRWEEVQLRPEAALVAQQVASDLTGGAFQISAIHVRDTIVVVEGCVRVRTPFLEAFLGIPGVTRSVQGVAEAAHGVERAGE